MCLINLILKSWDVFFCEGKGHASLFDCDKLKNSSLTARCRFVMSYRLCWRCLERGHIAANCPNNKIKACDKYLHCEIACSCDYRGKKFISGAISVNRSFHSTCGERKGVRLPILPIKIHTPRGERRIYALIDTGSEESLISRKLYREMDLQGLPLQVLLVTADGKRNLISTIDTKFKIGPIDKKEIKFDISSALVLDQMPSIDHSYPIADNLNSFKNLTDLIQNNKFPNLFDSDLHVIVGIREAGLINYEKIRKPCNPGEPFAARCKIGWTVFGPAPHLKNKPLTRCNFIRLSDEILEKKVDVLFHESFAERPHDRFMAHRLMTNCS